MFRPGATSGRARSGVFSVGSVEIPTPSYIVPTRRGAIPHLTPDHSPVVPIAAIYVEDFWRAPPASWKSLPLSAALKLSVTRRPGGNSRPANMETMGITTHQGKKSAKITELSTILPELGDILAVPYDDPQKWPPGSNRLQKLRKRSAAWAPTFYRERQGKPVFAAYAKDVIDTDDIYAVDGTAGWVISEPYPFEQLPADDEKVRVFGFNFISSPVEAVQLIENGADFIHLCLDELASLGHALDVDWIHPKKGSMHLDLNDPQYKCDMNLINGHARAYIHHMLECHEMTAQVILQQHNLQVFAKLFADIQSSLEHGTFAADCERFYTAYS